MQGSLELLRSHPITVFAFHHRRILGYDRSWMGFPLRILTVSELTSKIRDLLEGEFPEVIVEGEISNLRCPISGHFYFTLKDERAQIKAVLFRGQANFLKFDLANGQHVLCWGRVSVYEPKGEYQLIVDYVEPKGLGALQLAFEQLKRKLEQEGLFDPARKRPLPLLPRRIGIVTSPRGAVIRDMLNVLQRRFENLEILIYPVRVQGEGAAEEIAQGIDYLGLYGNVDVIIVARGGGSLEDLWAFNEEVVARSIYRCPVPVISAVGHETDYTISDFVADLRAPTPSAAAELVVRQKAELREKIASLEKRLLVQIRHLIGVKAETLKRLTRSLRDPRKGLEEASKKLEEMNRRLLRAVQKAIGEKAQRTMALQRILMSHSPDRELDRFSMHLEDLKGRLFSRLTQLIKGKADRLSALAGRLNALSPLAILERGYSITWLLPQQVLLKDSSQASPGDLVRVVLHRGELICEVKERH